jgi:prephenate dehydratase
VKRPAAEPPRRRVAFQGAFGAFSHEAALHHLPGALPTPYPSFAAVFQAVQAGACGLGFVPVSNSIAGPVPEVAELLPGSGLRVLAEHPWPIRMHLLAVAGAELDMLERVRSHPMALKQCGLFLAAQGLAAEAAFDTAGAAAEVAAAGDPRTGAIAPRAAADLYSLSILAEDVQDRTDNVTRFLVLSTPTET